jgi:hypothetical protein
MPVTLREMLGRLRVGPGGSLEAGRLGQAPGEEARPLREPPRPSRACTKARVMKAPPRKILSQNRG